MSPVATSETLRSVIDAGRTSRRLDELSAARVIGNHATDPREMAAEKHLFAYSVFYLFALFTVLVVDRWLPW